MGLVRYSMDKERKAPGEMRHDFVYDTADDRIILHRQQDVEPILKAAHRQRMDTNGQTADGSMMKAGSIPMVEVERIISEEGWNPMDPNESKRCLQWLDRPENQKFKTVEGRVARSIERNYFRASVATKVR